MTLFGLHALVGLVDLLFVSSLGTQAVAAVGAAVQIHFMVFALLAAVSTGTVALVARATGAGRADDASQVTRVSVLLSAILATAPMALMPFTGDLLSAMGMEPAVADLGGRCLRVLLVANIPFAVGATLSMALRGAGDVRTPLAIGILGNVVNLVADYALIFGNLGAPELGAVGSSVASGLAFVVDALLVVALWWRGMLVIRPGSPWRPRPWWGRTWVRIARDGRRLRAGERRGAPWG
jgi:Na+-driven multidrug efflux pump